MERNGKERENKSVTEKDALQLREKIQQELKEVQYGGLRGKVSNGNLRDFTGGSVVRTLHCQCRGPGLIPSQGTRSHMPQLRVCMPQLKTRVAKKKKKKKGKFKRNQIKLGLLTYTLE